MRRGRERGDHECFGDNIFGLGNGPSWPRDVVGWPDVRHDGYHRRDHGLRPVWIETGASAAGNRVWFALLGLICHYTVAFLAAATFVGVARFWSFPIDHFIFAGILYGPIVYFFMQLVVLPISNVHKRPFSVKMMVIGLIIHVICVGLPIAIAANKFLKE